MKRFAIFYALLLFFAGCKPDPAAHYRSLQEKYFKGKVPFSIVIEGAVKARGGAVFGEVILQKGVNSLFSAGDGSITSYSEKESSSIPFPRKGNVKVKDVLKFKERFAVLSGGSLFLYNKNEDMPRKVSLPGKEEIEAMAPWMENLLLMGGRKLYLLKEKDLYPREIFDRPFSSPVKKISRSYLTVYNNILIVAEGYAGYYHLAIVDIAKKKILATKIKASSHCSSFSEGLLTCVTGGSGAWKIATFDHKRGKKKFLLSLDSVSNIALFADGFILENNKGVFFHDYNGKALLFPSAGHLLGALDEKAVISAAGGKYLLFPFKEMFHELKVLQEKMPEAFTLPAKNK